MVKNKKYDYWISSGKFAFLQKMMILGIGVMGFMITARLLGPEKLGVWGLFLVISGIVETFRNALIKNAYIVFVNKSGGKKREEVEFASLFSNAILTVLICIILFTTGGYLETVFNAKGLSLVLRIYCLSLLVLVPFTTFENRFISNADFRSSFYLNLARYGSHLAGIAAMYFGGFGLSLRLLSCIYMISVLVGIATGLYQLRNQQPVTYRYGLETIRQYFHYGKFVLGNNLAALIFRNTDTFMSASVISATGSAYYSTSARIGNIADVPSQVFGDIMFPHASRIAEEETKVRLKSLYEKTVAATLVFSLPLILCVLVFAKPIIIFMAGAAFVPAVPILRIVILYGLFLPFVKQFGNVMDVSGKPHVNFSTMFAFAAFNVGANLFALRYFGLEGAAIGTLTSYFVLTCVCWVLLRAHFGVSFSGLLKNLFRFYGEFWLYAKKMTGIRLSI